MCDPVSIVTGVVGAAGVAASVSSANKQAKAIQASTDASAQATQQSIQFARDAQNIAGQEMGPWANTGSQANAAIASILGLPGPSAARPAAQPGGASAPGALSGGGGMSDAQAYLARYPDLAAEAARQASNRKSAFYQNPEAYAAWHWQSMGQREGRTFGADPVQPQPEAQVQTAPQTMPQPTAPAYSGVATNTNPGASGFEASPFGTMVQDAGATFESSPFYKIADDEIGKAIDSLDAKYGASGLLLSGGALRARGETMAGIRGDLFNQHLAARTTNFGDYFGALTNTSNSGLTAASGIASGGQNFANAASNAVQNNAANQQSAAVAAANTRQQGTADALGFGGWALGNLLNSNKTPATPKTTGGSYATSVGLKNIPMIGG